MIMQHLMGVIYHPKTEWHSIDRDKTLSIGATTMQYLLLALIPPVSLYIGTTQLGWTVSGSGYHLLTSESAASAAMAFYFAIIALGLIMTKSVHWMEKTYGSGADVEHCARLVLYSGSPMLMAGFIGLYPMLWLCVAVMLVAIAVSVYSLYVGVAEIMHIDEDRAFLYATSIVTVGLCCLVGLLAVSVMLWSTLVPLTIVAG